MNTITIRFFFIILLIKKEMGSGCLAPKPNQGDLPTQLIDQLHHSILSAPRQQRYLQDSTNYSSQKQKMFKKGPLRKLTDYLSSHRHKLVDSLAHNLKICIQKGTRQAWTTGLIILQRIVMMGGQTATATGPADKLQNILINKGQNSSFNDSERLKTESCSLKTESQKQNISGYYSLQRSPAQTILSQIISARFQSILLDTVSASLDDQQLYSECLRILCEYVKIKPKTMQNDDKVLILLTSLMQNLKIDYQSIITLETYYRLITKLKDKVVLSISSSLKTFIKMWIDFKGMIQCSKSIDIINKHQNKISTLQLIIARYLTSSLNGMQYKTMISLLMEVQDQYSFAIPLQFQRLYVYILNNSQLGQHLMKALFLQFLRYGVMGSFSSSVFKTIIESSQQLLSCHSQTTYRNVKNARQNLYELIKRWLVTKRYILLEDIIKYHSSLLVYCLLESVSSDYKSVCMDIIRQITPQQKIILIQTIFDIYQRSQTTPKIRYMLFQFHRTLSDELKEVTLMANNSRFIIDVSSLTATEALQVYSSLMALYAKFDKQTVLLYMQQICELLGSILSFLSEENEGRKEELINNLLSFISTIINIEGIVIAFYQKMLRVMQHKQMKGSDCSQLRIILTSLQKIFDRNMIKDYKQHQTRFDQRNEEIDMQSHQNSHGFKQCKSYFRDMAATDTRSKFYQNDHNFEKLNSVMKDEPEPKEEQSIRDIMEMINN